MCEECCSFSLSAHGTECVKNVVLFHLVRMELNV